MTALRCRILALVLSVGVPWPAHAFDILLDGAAPCLSIGGSWSDGTCTVDKLVVPSGSRLSTWMVGLAV